MASSNVWVSRFRGLTSIKVIRERSRIPAQPLTGLHKVSIKEAVQIITDEWARFYYPGEQECHVMQDLIFSALAHARKSYTCKSFVLTRCLAETFEAKDRYVPTCITGLTGVGKSALLKALARVFPPDGSVDMKPNYMPFPLMASSLFKVEGQTSPGEILKGLAGPGLYDIGPGFGKVQIASSRHFYVTGRCLAMIDEVQFMTQSDRATSAISKALLAVTYLGTPCVYGANFSLCGRLKRRLTPELKRRLLTSPVVLVPDPPDSKDWKGYLLELERAVPGVFSFKFEDKLRELWFLSAGVKAYVQELLLRAYERERRRGQISWEGVVEAYHSAKYSTTRHIIQELIAYAATRKKPSKDFEDLLCPFESDREVEYRASLAGAYNKQLADLVVTASLTAGEKRAFGALKKEAKKQQRRTPGKSETPLSAAELLANARRVLPLKTPSHASLG
jgi:hypothetical protein